MTGRSRQAPRFFAVHDVTRRAPPGRFGKWNGVRKRLDRLGRAGVFEDVFAIPAGPSDTARPVRMFDGTVIRAHVSAAGAKGGGRVRRPDGRALLGERMRSPAGQRAGSARRSI